MDVLQCYLLFSTYSDSATPLDSRLERPSPPLQHSSTGLLKVCYSRWKMDPYTAGGSLTFQKLEYMNLTTERFTVFGTQLPVSQMSGWAPSTYSWRLPDFKLQASALRSTLALVSCLRRRHTHRSRTRTREFRSLGH